MTPDRNRRAGLHNSRTERARRKATVDAWVQRHGPLCPGYDVAAHPSEDLTSDHVIPVAAGGREDGPLTVLCRACNTRKRDGRVPLSTKPSCQPIRSRNWLCDKPLDQACCPLAQ
jgi:hypothetical protein